MVWRRDGLDFFSFIFRIILMWGWSMWRCIAVSWLLKAIKHLIVIFRFHLSILFFFCLLLLTLILCLYKLNQQIPMDPKLLTEPLLLIINIIGIILIHFIINELLWFVPFISIFIHFWSHFYHFWYFLSFFCPD